MKLHLSGGGLLEDAASSMPSPADSPPEHAAGAGASPPRGCTDYSDFAGHIGIDEAGRGCLAGPVVAAAVLFPSSFDFSAELPGLDDSKRLKPAKR
ncbi:MAG: hypothetical protein LBC55_04405, partial [Desulfovibrio sp.]|nr:hypothetical protein [Desulfovibrio sp.]